MNREKVKKFLFLVSCQSNERGKKLRLFAIVLSLSLSLSRQLGLSVCLCLESTYIYKFLFCVYERTTHLHSAVYAYVHVKAGCALKKKGRGLFVCMANGK